MIWVDSKVGKEERFTTGLGAAAVWFDRHEDSINLSQCLGVIALHDPAFLGNTVFVEDPEVERLPPVRPAAAPGLKRRGILYPVLLVQIVRVKDQRLPLCIEYAAVRLLCAVAHHVIDFRDVEIPCPHKFADVAIMCQEFALLVERRFTVVKQASKFIDLSLRCLGASCVLRRLLCEGV